jgi:hypothetical protein
MTEHVTVTVLCPVLNRVHRVAPLAQSLHASLVDEENADVALLFLCTPNDHAEIAEIRKHSLWHMIVPIRRGEGEYSAKTNYGAQHTTSEWVLTGADDLEFRAGWLREAINAHIATGALVIGTNDTVNGAVKAGRHATHSLVHRDYLKQGTIDQPGILLHPGYSHNACDVEFTETAQARGVWAFAEKSLVVHRHPTFDRTIKRDATYEKGMQFATRDRILCAKRRHLWNPDAPTVRASSIRLAAKKRPAPVSRWPAR